MDESQYKNAEITIFPKATETETRTHKSLASALSRISKDYNKPLVQEISKHALSGDKDKANQEKRKLKCVMFTGKFDTPVEEVDEKTGEVTVSYRKEESLTKHSGVVILDFDWAEIKTKYQSAQELKSKLREDNYILACWLSPTHMGVKALVKIQDPEKHKEHYNSILAKFGKKYIALDTTNRNFSRVCYESYDPNIYINWGSWIYSDFLVDAKEEKKKLSTGDDVRVIYDYDYSKIQNCVKFLRKAKTGERNITLYKAARLAGGYIRSGYLPELLAKEILKEEYYKINPSESEHDTNRAIDNGVASGKDFAIYEMQQEEEEVLRVLGDRSSEYLADFNKETHTLMKWWRGELPMGKSTGFSELDKYYVLKNPHFTLNVGHDNIGKTYQMFYLLTGAAVNHGDKAIIYSPENITYTIIRDLMGMAAQKKVMDMNAKEFEFYNEFVREHFEIIDPGDYEYGDILSMCDVELGKKKFNHVLIDPYNALSRKSDNTYNINTSAAATFNQYTKTRKVGLFLNVHTRTEARKRKHEGGELHQCTKPPWKSDIEGGGPFMNAPDFIMVSHRYIDHPVYSERFTTQVRVEKVKDKMTGGSITPIGESFRMHLHYMSYFKCEDTGERGFEPPQPNITEF